MMGLIILILVVLGWLMIGFLVANLISSRYGVSSEDKELEVVLNTIIAIVWPFAGIFAILAIALIKMNSIARKTVNKTFKNYDKQH